MHTITINSLRHKLADGEKINLIDVREPEEHNEFNIGGTLLPLGHILAFQTEDIDQLKNEPVVCYCRSGKRSMQACMMLETMGFTNVLNLEGGMLAWQSL